MLDAEPAIQFAGRGLRDQDGAPVVYTENVFVKFADDAAPARRATPRWTALGLTVKRELAFATNAYFAAAPPSAPGGGCSSSPSELLASDDVELCHPELIREHELQRRVPAAVAPAAATAAGGRRARERRRGLGDRRAARGS